MRGRGRETDRQTNREGMRARLKECERERKREREVMTTNQSTCGTVIIMHEIY
jgi:hypothetical protein